MKILVKCPKCATVIKLEGYSENTECPQCQTKLKINTDNITEQKRKIAKLTVLLNIPIMLLGLVAYVAGFKLGNIAAGILLYQVIWVTIYRYRTMKMLK